MPGRTIATAGSAPRAPFDTAHGKRFGALHAHRFLVRVALSIANIFAWIFVFQYFFLYSQSMAGALIATALMYVISQTIIIILTPFSAAHLRHGVRRSMVYGTLTAGAAYIYLGATLANTFGGQPAGWGIAVFAILIGSYRALYFIPYELEAATNDPARFRIPIFYEIIIAFMPAFAGITLISQPFAPLRILFGSAVLMLISLLPLLFVKDAFEGFSWTYWKTFKELLSARHEKIVASSLLQGIQGASLFLLWPIAVFLIVGSSYQALGVIVSATLLAVMLLRKIYRRLMRKMRLENSVAALSAFAASGWMFRVFAGNPFGVLFADTYSHATSPRSSHSIDPFTFEQAADQGSYLDEYTALKEIALAIGRVAACALFALMLLFASISLAFTVTLILAAIASGASVILERRAASGMF